LSHGAACIKRAKNWGYRAAIKLEKFPKSGGTARREKQKIGDKGQCGTEYRKNRKREDNLPGAERSHLTRKRKGERRLSFRGFKAGEKIRKNQRIGDLESKKKSPKKKICRS